MPTSSANPSSARRARATPPVTAHRLFPVLVASWFAALFGLGSFALSPRLLEAAIVASGLPALVPAAAPPLGFTFRVLFALMMTAAGGGAGLALGLRLRPRAVAPARRRFGTGATVAESESDAPRVRPRDAHPDAPPRKPLVLTVDLLADADPIATAEPGPARRRALALADEGTASEEFPTLAPLPLIPADVPELAAESAPVRQPEPEDETDPAPVEIGLPEPLAEVPQTSEPLASRAAARAAEQGGLADVPVEALGLVQLVERLALAISARREALGAALAESTDEADRPAPQAVVPAAAVEAVEEVPGGDEGSPLITLPRMMARLDAVAAPARAVSTVAVEADEGEESVEALVGPRFLGNAAPRQVFHETPAEPEVDEARYPSLLEVSGHAPRIEAAPIAQGIVEEDGRGFEPVVIFPGQGPRAAGSPDGRAPFARPMPGGAQAYAPSPAALPDPEEADRALRAALATLQRMTAKG